MASNNSETKSQQNPEKQRQTLKFTNKNRRKLNSFKKNKKSTKLYFTFFLLFSIMSLVLSQGESPINPSYAFLKFNREGQVQVLGESFNDLPNAIYINDVQIEGEISKTVNINNATTEIVKLEWRRKLTTCSGMFYNIQEIVEIDLSQFDSSEVTDMSAMFDTCTFLNRINLNGFKTSSVKNMAGMFRSNERLLELDLSQFDTSKVENMYQLFYNVKILTSLDVSSFNTSLVNNMQETFRA